MARGQRTSEDIIADAMNELRAAVEKFANTLSQQTTDISSFLTMDKLENMMGLEVHPESRTISPPILSLSP